MKRLKQQGIPVVAVFLSGRPLWVNREINASDAFVAAWLPGSEGGGVADVLLRDEHGKVAHDFSGKLSYSWPRSAAQTPLNVGQGGPAAQFAYGYGLKYGEDGNLASLSEDSGVDLGAAQTARFFAGGAVAKGWRLRVVHASTPFHFTRVAEAKNTSLTITAVDYKAQEDAWRYEWVAGGSTSVAFVPPEALDFSRETNGDVMLLMTLRMETPTPKETALFVECGNDCGAHVLVGAQLASLPSNQWLRVGIPLKCFAAAGANMGNLTVTAGIESTAGNKLAISEVGYGTVADHVLSCGSF
jgi:beta-glucosidase